jgi:hypothetical protein
MKLDANPSDQRTRTSDEDGPDAVVTGLEVPIEPMEEYRQRPTPS